MIVKACLNEKLPVVFIGYSYGGNVAYECAFNLSIKYGIDVNHCIKIASSSYADEDSTKAYFDGFDRAAFFASSRYSHGKQALDEGYNIYVYTRSFSIMQYLCFVFSDIVMLRELQVFSRSRVLTLEKVTASLTTIIGVDDPTTVVSIFGKFGWMVKRFKIILRVNCDTSFIFSNIIYRICTMVDTIKYYFQVLKIALLFYKLVSR